jgi:hypothetical protein
MVEEWYSDEPIKERQLNLIEGHNLTKLDLEKIKLIIINKLSNKLLHNEYSCKNKFTDLILESNIIGINDKWIVCRFYIGPEFSALIRIFKNSKPYKIHYYFFPKRSGNSERDYFDYHLYDDYLIAISSENESFYYYIPNRIKISLPEEININNFFQNYFILFKHDELYIYELYPDKIDWNTRTYVGDTTFLYSKITDEYFILINSTKHKLTIGIVTNADIKIKCFYPLRCYSNFNIYDHVLYGIQDWNKRSMFSYNLKTFIFKEYSTNLKIKKFIQNSPLSLARAKFIGDCIFNYITQEFHVMFENHVDIFGLNYLISGNVYKFTVDIDKILIDYINSKEHNKERLEDIKFGEGSALYKNHKSSFYNKPREFKSPFVTPKSSPRKNNYSKHDLNKMIHEFTELNFKTPKERFIGMSNFK